MNNTQRQQILDNWHKPSSAFNKDAAEVVEYSYYGHAGLVDVFNWYLIKFLTVGSYHGNVDIHMANRWEKIVSILLAAAIIPLGMILSDIFGINGNKGLGAVIVGVSIAIYVLLACLSYPQNKRRARSHKGVCRNCSYTLDPSFSAGTVETKSGELEVGPEICSECGQRWPLILPH